mgnify:CR=1 FL=1
MCAHGHFENHEMYIFRENILLMRRLVRTRYGILNYYNTQDLGCLHLIR